MWLAALAIAVLYIGSTLLTPLYPLYRQQLGFSELIVTEIYAIYVVGNLTVLFFLGRLSDQIGRCRATLLALALPILSALCFPARDPNRVAVGGARVEQLCRLPPRQCADVVDRGT